MVPSALNMCRSSFVTSQLLECPCHIERLAGQFQQKECTTSRIRTHVTSHVKNGYVTGDTVEALLQLPPDARGASCGSIMASGPSNTDTLMDDGNLELLFSRGGRAIGGEMASSVSTHNYDWLLESSDTLNDLHHNAAAWWKSPLNSKVNQRSALTS